MTVVNDLWYLEGFSEGGRDLRRIPLLTLPFHVGRRAGLDLSLSSTSVSQHHAMLFETDGTLMIRDLDSTNGTFVNRERLQGERPLAAGDVLHFANLEFRLGRLDRAETEALTGRTSVVDGESLRLLIGSTEQLGDLLANRRVVPLFQPIVSLSDDAIMGYEILGRGNHPELPQNITELFELASYVGVEAELSRLFRAESVAACQRIERSVRLFFNTHPAELLEEGLVESLAQLRAACPERPITLEIHEAAVTDLVRLRALKRQLTELQMELAYDDFGVGQARLLELADTPPEYLKFDLSLIRDIDTAPPSRRRVVENLVKMAHELGIQLIAEGVESREEAAACLRLGFHYGQGFLYGMPLTPDELG